MAKAPPYEGKELDEIVEHIKQGSKWMKQLKLDDPKFKDYFDRFLKLVDYFTAYADPIGGLRLITDRRYSYIDKENKTTPTK
jgi:hypothetical protein